MRFTTGPPQDQVSEETVEALSYSGLPRVRGRAPASPRKCSRTEEPTAEEAPILGAPAGHKTSEHGLRCGSVRPCSCHRRGSSLRSIGVDLGSDLAADLRHPQFDPIVDEDWEGQGPNWIAVKKAAQAPQSPRPQTTVGPGGRASRSRLACGRTLQGREQDRPMSKELLDDSTPCGSMRLVVVRHMPLL